MDTLLEFWNSVAKFLPVEHLLSLLSFIAEQAGGLITGSLLTLGYIKGRRAITKVNERRAIGRLDKASLSGPSFRVMEFGPSILVEHDSLVDSGVSFLLSPDKEHLPGILERHGESLSFSEPQAFGQSPEAFFLHHAGGRYLEFFKKALEFETAKLVRGDGSMRFNNRLFGVKSFRSGVRIGDDERPKLVGTFYKTDYFTFSVVQRMINMMPESEQSRIRAFNSDLSTLETEFFPFVPSVAINAFLFSEDETKVFLVVRSKNAAQFEGQRPFYPSVNEALSQTDLVNTPKCGVCPSLLRCLERGFEEELGITSAFLHDVSFSHIAYGTVGVGMGVFATCRTTKNYHEIRNLLPAKDRTVEVADVLEVEFNKRGILNIIHDKKCSPHVAASLIMIAAAKGISIH